MRVALLADIHANLPALHSVLADAEKHGCSRIFHAGDLVAIGPYPAGVVDLAIEAGITCVKGNHEEWFDEALPSSAPTGINDNELRHHYWTHSRLSKKQRDFLSALPYEIREEVSGVRLQVVHFALSRDEDGFASGDVRGMQDSDMLELFGYTDADLVCFGHIHERPMDIAFNGTRFLNPGAVGCNQAPYANYAILELKNNSSRIIPRRVQYDRTELLARYDQLEIPDRNLIRKHFFGV